MADNETIADIRKDAETKFRELVEAYIQRRSSFQTTMGAMQAFNNVFDRIEAAHKREIEATAAKCCQLGRLAGYGASEIKRQQEPVGDAAKLREALMYLFNLIDMRKLVLDCDETEEIYAVQVMLDECRAALAAPPRNCDKVKTSWDVLKKWHEGLDTANDIVRMLDWLLAPATEQEGGEK